MASTAKVQMDNMSNEGSITKVTKTIRKAITGDEETRVRDEVPKLIKEQAKIVQSKVRKVVTGDETKEVREFIKEKEAEPKYIKQFDKYTFTLGVINISICQYFLLNQPTYYWLWYSLVMPLLVFTRIFHFKSLGWQYFLLDFCYFVVCLTLVNLFIISNQDQFNRIMFIFANGPLTVAILVWRNSFVFHDFDRMTSVYIHLLPSMLYYTERWHGHTPIFALPNVLSWMHKIRHINPANVSEICANNANVSYEHCENWSNNSLEFSDYLLAATVYIIWQVAYYIKTEIIDKEKLDSCPNILTSLRWLTSDTKNPLARFVLFRCRDLGIFRRDEDYDSKTVKTKVVFMVSQFIYTLITFFPTYFIYRSHFAHLAYIAFIYINSVYNAASFYIEVFSKRYQSQFINDNENNENNANKKIKSEHKKEKENESDNNNKSELGIEANQGKLSLKKVNSHGECDQQNSEIRNAKSFGITSNGNSTNSGEQNGDDHEQNCLHRSHHVNIQATFSPLLSKSDKSGKYSCKSDRSTNELYEEFVDIDQ